MFIPGQTTREMNHNDFGPSSSASELMMKNGMMLAGALSCYMARAATLEETVVDGM